MPKSISFRLATTDDANALLNIYAYYVQETNITFEYEVPSLTEFTQRIQNVTAKFPYVVAIIDGKIIGYAYVSVFRSRAAYNWGVETSIYLDKNFSGQKIGEKLYRLLEEIVKLQNITNLIASITYPNPHSMSFHEKLGYKKIAHFTKCGYKSGKWCDMIFMEKFINEHTIPAKDIIYLANLDKEKLNSIFHKYNN